jgi:type I restriction-modification system DNA methylase subunit
VNTVNFEKQTKELIDNLKAICSSYGLGNDGNEFKIITQLFLYKFLNDKFAFSIKELEPKLAEAKSWEKAYGSLEDDAAKMLLMELSANTATLKPKQLITYLFEIQNSPDFAKTFDDTFYGYARHFKFLKQTNIILPNKDIAINFDKIVKVFYSKIRENIFQTQTLKAQRDFLLPMLMNGQVSIK